MKESLNTVETITKEKQTRLILIKQNLDINPLNRNDITNKVLIMVFSMLAELKRDFISERTKEGLKARKDKGISLGKPKGVIQASIYDKDKDKIFHLHSLGVPLNIITKNPPRLWKISVFEKLHSKKGGNHCKDLVKSQYHPKLNGLGDFTKQKN